MLAARNLSPSKLKPLFYLSLRSECKNDAESSVLSILMPCSKTHFQSFPKFSPQPSINLFRSFSSQPAESALKQKLLLSREGNSDEGTSQSLHVCPGYGVYMHDSNAKPHPGYFVKPSEKDLNYRLHNHLEPVAQEPEFSHQQKDRGKEVVYLHTDARVADGDDCPRGGSILRNKKGELLCAFVFKMHKYEGISIAMAGEGTAMSEGIDDSVAMGYRKINAYMDCDNVHSLVTRNNRKSEIGAIIIKLKSQISKLNDYPSHSGDFISMKWIKSDANQAAAMLSKWAFEKKLDVGVRYYIGEEVFPKGLQDIIDNDKNYPPFISDEVRKAQKQVAEENKCKAITITLEKAELAASDGKKFCISHVDVGRDLAAVREAVTKVMNQKGLSVMVFSTDKTSNKAVICAGVPEKGDKGKLDVSEWLSNAVGPLKGKSGKGKGGLATGRWYRCFTSK
ncbi:hypothetical protein OROGR_013597 [Orobanche gracilis]